MFNPPSRPRSVSCTGVNRQRYPHYESLVARLDIVQFIERPLSEERHEHFLILKPTLFFDRPCYRSKVGVRQSIEAPGKKIFEPIEDLVNFFFSGEAMIVLLFEGIDEKQTDVERSDEYRFLVGFGLTQTPRLSAGSR